MVSPPAKLVLKLDAVGGMLEESEITTAVSYVFSYRGEKKEKQAQIGKEGQF